MSYTRMIQKAGTEDTCVRADTLRHCPEHPQVPIKGTASVDAALDVLKERLASEPDPRSAYPNVAPLNALIRGAISTAPSTCSICDAISAA